MMKEKGATTTSLAAKQKWKQGHAKINIASFIHFQIAKLQKFVMMHLPKHFVD